jgi:hypothetical protein
MDPKELSLRILVAIADNTEELIVCDTKTKLAIYAKTLFPSLISMYMNSRAKSGWAQFRKSS